MNSESRPPHRARVAPVAPPSPPVAPTPQPSTLAPIARKAVPRWRFWLPLAIQAALIVVIPLQATYTQVTGRPVVLQTGPFDPYNPFRGYYVRLGYDISQASELENLPGWKEFQAKTSQRRSLFVTPPSIYVILEAPQTEGGQPPQAWKPVAVSGDLPDDLPQNQIALKGIYRSGWINYGLEQYYMPEAERLDINNRIAEIQQANPQKPEFVMEVKVRANGEAVPVGMWLRDQPYRF